MARSGQPEDGLGFPATRETLNPLRTTRKPYMYFRDSAGASEENTLFVGALPLAWFAIIALIVAKLFAAETAGLFLSKIGWDGICVTAATLALVTILFGWPKRRQLIAGTIAAGLGGAAILFVVTVLSV